MNRASQKPLLNDSNLINPVSIRVTNSIFSNLEDDLVFNKIKTPVFCSGKILNTSNNAYNLKVNDHVVFISFQQKEILTLSSNLVCKLPEKTTDALIAIIPYASYAMKILRLTNPKIGQNIIIDEISFFTILLKELFEISGAKTFMISNNQKKTEYHSFLEEDKIFNGLEFALEACCENEIKFDTLLYFHERKTNMHQLMDFVDNKYDLSEISFYDVGLDDENYLKGVKYPLNYVRWHYQNNLNYFISLVKQGFIKLDLIDYFPIKFDNIEELDNFISNISEKKRFLFYF